MHRFFTSNIDTVNAQLDETETRHLRDVLRIREGEQVRIFDGEGREFLATVSAISKRSASLKIDEKTSPAAPESTLDLTLAIALTKGEKFELAIQKAVELGVNRIVPIVTKRCDVKPSGSDKRAQRWRRIALDACKQSGRARLITIENPSTFESLLAMEFSGSKVLFSERDGGPLEAVSGSASMLAVIGPEGGWEDDEISEARSAGFEVVTLGGRILRAETAAIVIAAVLQNHFGDLN